VKASLRLAVSGAVFCLLLAACGPARETFTIKILDGTIAVENAGYRCDTVVIGDTLYRPRLTGPFTVSGSGTGADIRISVVNGANYRNWQGIGADYSSYYYSGEVTGGTINASLPSLKGDTYYILYDNRFDPFRDKDVNRRIDLEYQQ
jgi:hypothetical protein